MHLTDSHCHLDDEQFAAERDDVIRRAQDAGVRYMLTIGTGNGPPELDCAVRLADEHDFIYATVGVHPNDAPKVGDRTFSNLEHVASHPKVVAIGEIGLDYHWGVPKEVQAPVFVQQLDIAKQLGLPVVIHTRDAWDETLRVLREHWAGSGLPCVMHCFTGTVQQASECLDLGFTLAFGGVTTFPKAVELREVARTIPIESFLLETDAPYLAPVPHRGKRNEPAFVTHTAGAIAKLRGIKPEQVSAATTSNFERVFRIGTQVTLT